MSLKGQIRRLFRACGLEIDYLSRHPRETLAGAINLPIRTIFDVGANVGQFARFAACKFPGATIHSFEPQPDVFRVLAAEATRHSGRLIAVNTALGDTIGTIKMHAHIDHSPSSSILETTALKRSLYPATARAMPIEVPITTLDAYIRSLANPLRDDLLLKLDVQGYESRVLNGAGTLLSGCRACLLEISLAPLYDKQAKFTELIANMQRYGLRYAGNISQVMDNRARVLYIDAMFIRN